MRTRSQSKKARTTPSQETWSTSDLVCLPCTISKRCCEWSDRSTAQPRVCRHCTTTGSCCLKPDKVVRRPRAASTRRRAIAERRQAALMKRSIRKLQEQNKKRKKRESMVREQSRLAAAFVPQAPPVKVPEGPTFPSFTPTYTLPDEEEMRNMPQMMLVATIMSTMTTMLGEIAKEMGQLKRELSEVKVELQRLVPDDL